MLNEEVPTKTENLKNSALAASSVWVATSRDIFDSEGAVAVGATRASAEEALLKTVIRRAKTYDGRFAEKVRAITTLKELSEWAGFNCVRLKPGTGAVGL